MSVASGPTPRRGQILRAIQELASEGDPATIPVAEIAAHASLALRDFYAEFDSKDEALRRANEASPTAWAADSGSLVDL